MTPSPRDQMISTAMKLFQREGYAATSWRKLIEASGAPWGSAHHYFPGGKEQLGVAAVEKAGEGLARFFESCFTADRTAADGVQKLFEGSAQNLERSGYCEGCPIATVALETAATSPALAEASRQGFLRWQDAIEAGLLRSGVSADRAPALAEALLTLLEGALILARVTRSPAPLLKAGASMKVLLQQA